MLIVSIFPNFCKVKWVKKIKILKGLSIVPLKIPDRSIGSSWHISTKDNLLYYRLICPKEFTYIYYHAFFNPGQRVWLVN